MIVMHTTLAVLLVCGFSLWGGAQPGAVSSRRRARVRAVCAGRPCWHQASARHAGSALRCRTLYVVQYLLSHLSRYVRRAGSPHITLPFCRGARARRGSARHRMRPSHARQPRAHIPSLPFPPPGTQPPPPNVHSRRAPATPPRWPQQPCARSLPQSRCPRPSTWSRTRRRRPPGRCGPCSACEWRAGIHAGAAGLWRSGGRGGACGPATMLRAGAGARRAHLGRGCSGMGCASTRMILPPAVLVAARSRVACAVGGRPCGRQSCLSELPTYSCPQYI